MISFRSSHLLAIALVLLGAPDAAGQDQALETAKAHFDEGQNLYLLGKYTEAAEEFTRAYESRSYPAFLFNIAVCHEKNRDFIKALAHYERYLKEDPHSQDKDLVVQRIAAIREHLNPKDAAGQPTSQPVTEAPKLPPVKTKGLVVIESKPEGAAIYFEDKKRGIFTRTPYTGTMPEGKHTVILEMRKYKPERKTFTARTDRMVYLYFAMSSEDYLGWIEVKGNVPAADVYFDKKEVGAVGRTPYTGFLRPGKRTIMVEKAGYAPFKRELEIAAGKDHVINVTLKKVSHGWLKLTGMTTAGATIKVNGRPLDCQGPPCRTDLPEGAYRVELVRKGFKTYLHEVTVKAATETQLAVRLNPKPSRLKAYVTFGIHGTLLAGAIVAAVMSKNRQDSLEEDLAAGRLFDSSDSRLTEGKVTAIVADSLFALAGVTGALGIYYLFRNVGPDSFGEVTMNKIAILPALGPQHAGLQGQVRF